MDPARQLAELLERLRELGAGPGEQLARSGRVAREPRLGEPKRQRERDEPLLRAVVQVALEPPPLGVARLDDARARPAQLVLVGGALGDVDAGDEMERAARFDLRHRRTRPGDRPPLTAAGEPARLGRDGFARLGHRRG